MISYEQIKEDVRKLKEYCYEEDFLGYCLMTCLLLELCLKEKGIKSEVVLGYLIVDNTYWFSYYWNKIEIEGKIKQIDASVPPDVISGLGQNFQYSFELKSKWTSLDENGERNRIELNKGRYNAYKQIGPAVYADYALKKCRVEERLAWKNISQKAKLLPTFEHIEKFINYDIIEIDLEE
ncbi:hypothetical protein CONCODRAFT_80729 [Conidiobolus coronatus NRRL 28638]|uniref:Uncharacterized protein n=1 Tax=Conidiobolus coronatus (strain ATCC 28846 / CBS 209.66 / NRRL 28638) TaxID=796925 RepID=A0A137NS77_CONC2|nr:hypothetical protein CONCODRAFT_80729 [Conidiobolus coronatus NRRL 28638]|eukprot:KXN65597.1 hypothetical protein CONCODRAFT_80729 [Conidiobolus coronatus NRRL 28638]